MTNLIKSRMITRQELDYLKIRDSDFAAANNKSNVTLRAAKVK